ncbi:MAG: 3'(2'),5'-bisphosphate nucleotidase CysQ [bacterium]
MAQYSDWLAVAEGLALEASRAVAALMQGPIKAQRKDDHSPVTEADFASDRILREGLSKNFPAHAILTEESGLSGPAEAEYVWLIDPLDGTKAFAKGIPGFCVMVGLLQGGAPLLGVVVDPLTGRVYRALRGAGATLSEGDETRSLRVSGRRDFSEMPLVVSTGFPEAPLRAVRGRLPGPLLPPINSVGIKVGILARQEADIYLNHHEVSYWDTCAPKLILEEAGGSFTALDGSPLTYPLRPPYGHGVKTLASNGTRHGEIVAQLRELAFGSRP